MRIKDKRVGGVEVWGAKPEIETENPYLSLLQHSGGCREWCNAKVYRKLWPVNKNSERYRKKSNMECW